MVKQTVLALVQNWRQSYVTTT